MASTLITPNNSTTRPQREVFSGTEAYADLSLNIFLIASVEYDLGRSRAASIFGEAYFYNNEAGALTSTERTVPDELGGDTERARDAEEDGVEVHLVEAVVREEHARVRVDVRPGVLRLAGLEEDAGDDVVHLVDELEHLVVGQVLERELALRHVARVGLAEHRVAVAGHDLAALERRPDVLAHGVVRRVLADLGLHLAQPDEHLLVREAVEGARETVQGGAEREEGVGEGGADELAGVRRDVAALVVRVDGDVEAHELDEVGLVGEAEQVGEVVGVVLVGLDRGELAAAVDVTVDAASNGRELGNPGGMTSARLIGRKSPLRDQRTDPSHPRRWAASTPSWRYPAGRPWQTPSRG